MFALLLYVAETPSIIMHPIGKSILKGSNYTLMCSASGSGILTYSWERSSNGSSWTTVIDDNTTSYTVPLDLNFTLASTYSRALTPFHRAVSQCSRVKAACLRVRAACSRVRATCFRG